MTDEAINPKVNQSINDISGERVAENSAENMPRHFWSSLKNGHYRFALTGVAISLPISITIGAAVSLLVGGALAPLIIAGFIGAGALMAAEGFGSSGAAAASRASGLAEKHARELAADARGINTVGAADDKLMVTGRGHHFEQPIGRDKGKFFAWRSGLAGAGLGAASGGVLGLGAGVAAGHLTGLAGIAAAAAHAPVIGAVAAGIVGAGAAPIAALAIAGALVFGAFGATFGIERNVLKSALNTTDSFIQGKTKFTNGPDLGRAQSMESDYRLAQQRISRQAEIETLEKSYNDRISWGALSGRFRGFAAVVPGVLGGATMGALIVGGLALAGATGGLAVPALAALIVPLFSAGGGLLAINAMSESGMEAGAEATARAIDNEFERNRALRAKGILPPAPKEAEEKWFSGKAFAICAAVGAVVGIALAPALGVGALALAGIHGVAAFGAPAIATSMLVSGLIGGSYGLGSKSLKALAKPAQTFYDNVGHQVRKNTSGIVSVQQECALLPQPPACEPITAEEMARLNEKTAASNGKNFVQTITDQQMQPAQAGMQA